MPLMTNQAVYDDTKPISTHLTVLTESPVMNEGIPQYDVTWVDNSGPIRNE